MPRWPQTIVCPKVAPFGAPTCIQVGDSTKSSAMTAIEFRDKKLREIQELLEKLSSLEGASFSPENKDRLFRTYQRQIEGLTAIVYSPAFERLCSS
jgi:hypothetical protein